MKLAVEWFANRISHGGLVSKKQFDELLEQAKAMEEDGKHESYLYGHKVGFTKAKEMEKDEHLQKAIEISNEYFNTIFKQTEEG
jgi:hypothetical protein